MARSVGAAGRYDAEVGIVGAGPAGARAAELLGSLGVEVLLWDPKAPWEKPCGGGLTGALLRHLPDLAGVVPEAQRIEVVRLETAAGGSVEIPLEQPLYVISRAGLSRWQLARARSAGAEFLPAAVHGVERASGWRVRSGSAPERRVRCLIGADGAASRVRAAVSPNVRLELAPTRVAFVPGPGASATRIDIRFTRGEPGYAWDFARPGHRSVGVVREPGRWTRAELDAEVDHLRAAANRAEEAPVVRAGAVIATAWFRLRPGYPEIGAADFALLGDAAGLADPATGEGIHNALCSAELAVEAFATDRSFASYPRRAAARFEPEFRAARLLRRFLYGHDAAARLVQAATRHTSAYALLVAWMDAANAHDTAVLGRWLRTYFRAIRTRGTAASGGRPDRGVGTGSPERARVPHRVAADGQRQQTTS